MARLSLRLLGGFRARLGSGAPLALTRRKAEALLAYLAMQRGEASPRDTVATLLWGDTGEEQARQSLRQTLVALRNALGAQATRILVVDRDGLALNPTAVDVDVLTFERLAGTGTARALAQAADLYRGDLLDGFRMKEAAFEEWLAAERARLRHRAVEALAQLQGLQTRAGDLDAALHTGARLLALEPAQEGVHRALMQLYARQGRVDLGLRQYRRCVDVLRRELHVDPDAETRALYQELLQRRAGPAPSPPREDTRVRPRPSRAPAPRPSDEFRLIGRDPELTRLREVLGKTWQGHGRAILITGEAGIGKSRLIETLGAEAVARGGRVLLGRSYESEQILPFGPWVDAVRQARILEDDRLLGSLGTAWRGELSRLFPELAEVGSPPPTDPTDLLHLFEAVARLLAQVAAAQPLVVIMEDVHWSDEVSVRLFASLGRRARVPALFVATAREEEIAVTSVTRRAIEELELEGRLLRITLASLSQADTATLVEQLAPVGGPSAASHELAQRVWALSEGHPFMVIETMRALHDGAVPTPAGELPLAERIRRVIAGRLERVGARGRQLVAVAAAVGRESEARLLQRAAQMSDSDAAEALDELLRRRILEGIGERFQFTHDRIREVAYAELAAPRRALLHARVVETMEALYADDLEPHLAALAHHASAGALGGKAVDYLRAAGAQAAKRGALHDSVELYERALELVTQLPTSAENTRRAIDVRLDFNVPLFPLGRAARLVQLHREAEELARELDDQARLGRVAYRMGSYSWMDAKYENGIAYGRQALDIATLLQDRELRVASGHILGVNLEAKGEFPAAIEQFRAIIDGPDAELAKQRRGATISTYVAGCAWMAMCLAQTGNFERAVVYGDRGVEEAEATHHAFARAFAATIRAYPPIWQGEFAAALSWAERAVRLCDEKGVSGPLPAAYSALGYALICSGRLEGLPHLERGATLYEKSAFKTRLSEFYARWAEGLLAADRIEEAKRTADTAVALAVAARERGNEAEALYVTGRVASAQHSRASESAQEAYQHALAIAKDLGMRPLAARCQFGLGTLYRVVGKDQEARDELTAAAALFQTMAMRSWLHHVDLALAALA